MLVNVSPVAPARAPGSLPALYTSPAGKVGLVWEDESWRPGAAYHFTDLATGQTSPLNTHPDAEKPMPGGSRPTYARLAVGHTVTLSNDD